jgi:hypothetical protein
MKKLLMIILCALVLTFAIAGCANDSNGEQGQGDETNETGRENLSDEYEDGGTEEVPTNGAGTEDGGFFDFEFAFAAFPPNTVMVDLGDLTITWEELFFGLHNTITSVLMSQGEITDWSEIIFDDVTLAEAVLNNAVENLLDYKAVEFATGLLGMSYDLVTDALRSEIEMLIAEYEGEDALMEMLWQNAGVRSRDFLDYIISTSLMINHMFEEMYGIEGSLLADEDIEAYYAAQGEEFLMAKHILFSTMEEEGADTAEERALEVLQMLVDFDGDDFSAFFDELMFLYSEDPGSFSFPDGYIFQYHEMVEEFSAATVELEIGGFSELVESSFGFHIIHRIPLNFDVPPMGSQISLRYIAAQTMFSTNMFEWANSLNVEHTAEFYSIVLEDIFVLN